MPSMVKARDERSCYQVPPERGSLADRDFGRWNVWPTPALSFPEFDHLRECLRGPVLENAGIRLIDPSSPSIVLGNVPRWHPVTASLPLGLCPYWPLCRAQGPG